MIIMMHRTTKCLRKTGLRDGSASLKQFTGGKTELGKRVGKEKVVAVPAARELSG